MNGTEIKRFMRYFYDPPPKYDDMSGTSIWLLGKEYKAVPPKPVTTTEHDDLVEVESSTDSRDPSDAASGPSTIPESQQQPPSLSSSQNTSSFDDAETVTGGENAPSLSNDPSDRGWPITFLDDFESRIWMTYRSNFPPIPRSHDANADKGLSWSVRLRNLTEKEGFSSDTGWGCMIRSGQSLLANALMMLHLGRDWRRPGTHTHRTSSPPPPPPETASASPTSQSEASILSLFADAPTASFSIHRFVQHGASACGKHPGQWFGPSATASCIQALSSECAAAGLRVYVTPSASEVYEDRFRSIATDTATGKIQPTLILLGIRLGLDRITPVYHEALKSSLTYPQSIGIAGGRPSSSHYFIGCQGDLFFYLDPHETRPFLPHHALPRDYTDEEIASCHTRRLRGLRIGEMDPSMLIGFLIKSEEDWKDWRRRLGEVKGKAIINVFEKEPPVPGETVERKEAVDEVETFDDEDDDETVTVTGEGDGEERKDGVDGAGTDASKVDEEPVKVEHGPDSEGGGHVGEEPVDVLKPVPVPPAQQNDNGVKVS
jgi:cysteine protease ATG4